MIRVVSEHDHWGKRQAADQNRLNHRANLLEGFELILEVFAFGEP